MAQRDGGARKTMSTPLVARYRAALAERLEALIKT
jgi:hypothetical protein